MYAVCLQLTSQKIANLFQVNFHVGNFDEVLEMRVTFDNRLKDLLRDPGNNTLKLIVVDISTLCPTPSVNFWTAYWTTHHHGECLSTACLPVCEDCAIVTIEDICGYGEHRGPAHARRSKAYP